MSSRRPWKGRFYFFGLLIRQMTKVAWPSLYWFSVLTAFVLIFKMFPPFLFVFLPVVSWRFFDALFRRFWRDSDPANLVIRKLSSQHASLKTLKPENWQSWLAYFYRFLEEANHPAHSSPWTTLVAPCARRQSTGTPPCGWWSTFADMHSASPALNCSLQKVCILNTVH